MTFSISATYYELRDDGKEWLFPLVMIAFTTPIVLLAWNHSAISIAGILIIMSGLTGDARDNEITERNHWIGATGGMFFAGLQMLLWQYHILWTAMIVISGTLWTIKPKNHTYWIEVIVYILTVIGITIKFV
jgi:hypothetical protein